MFALRYPTASGSSSTQAGSAAPLELRHVAHSALCEPKVYQDNMPFSGTMSELSQSVSPRDVMGIEVYSTADQPPQFQGSCGVIVVWTKSDA